MFYSVALYLLRIIIFALLFVATSNFIKLIHEKKIAEKIVKNIDKINEDYQKRLINLRYRQYYVSTDKKKNYLEGLDILIEKTNIRNKFSIMSSEVLIIISVINSFIIFIYAYRFLYNFLAGLIIALFCYFIPEYILKIFAHRNANKADEQLVHYINVLKNFCQINDDIVFAIEKSIPYTRDPIRTFNIHFMAEVKHGISPFEALENYKNKIDNKKFKLLIKNLQLCVKHNGKYIEVLDKSKDIIKNYNIEKKRRKSEGEKAKTAILAMIVISLVIIFSMTKINPDLVGKLRTSFVGQMVVIFNVIVYLVTIYMFLTVERFNH